MNTITVFYNAIAMWFKSWRSAKAGAELEAGKKAKDETDRAAEEIVAELRKLRPK